MTNTARTIGRWLRHFTGCLGQRGVLLLVFALTAFGYGIGLLSGYEPTFSHALGVSDIVFGVMFIADGIILTIGSLFRWGRFPYCVAAAVSFFWAFTLTAFWAAPFGWAASMSWLGMGFVQVCTILWPEPIQGKKLLSIAFRFSSPTSDKRNEDSEDDTSVENDK